MCVGSSASKPRLLEIRVATGIPDRQLSSAIWRIWQGKNTDDVYIAVRQIAGAVKCPLHSNGSVPQIVRVKFNYSGFFKHIKVPAGFCQ